MKRWPIQSVIALLIFASGAIGGALWKSLRTESTQAPTTQGLDDIQRPLTKANVSRSLQSHSFRTDKLRKNSNDDVVWRWLKDSIAKYPQNWVQLNINDTDRYGVVLYPPKTLEPMELAHCNRQLTETGLPLVSAGKRYVPIEINVGDIICPDWYGLVDPDEAQLVFFEGRSG